MCKWCHPCIEVLCPHRAMSEAYVHINQDFQVWWWTLCLHNHFSVHIVTYPVLDQIERRIRRSTPRPHKIYIFLLFLVRASAWLNTWSCASVCLSACLFQLAYCLNDQAHIAWFTSGVARGQLRGRRRSLKYYTLWRKTTFDRRRLAHCWKAHGAGQKWK